MLYYTILYHTMRYTYIYIYTPYCLLLQRRRQSLPAAAALAYICVGMYLSISLSLSIYIYICIHIHTCYIYIYTYVYTHYIVVRYIIHYTLYIVTIISIISAHIDVGLVPVHKRDHLRRRENMVGVNMVLAEYHQPWL